MADEMEAEIQTTEERNDVKKERNDVKKERNDVKKERNDVKKERNDVKKERNDVKKERNDVKKERNDVKKERNDVKKERNDVEDKGTIIKEKDRCAKVTFNKEIELGEKESEIKDESEELFNKSNDKESVKQNTREIQVDAQNVGNGDQVVRDAQIQVQHFGKGDLEVQHVANNINCTGNKIQTESCINSELGTRDEQENKEKQRKRKDLLDELHNVDHPEQREREDKMEVQSVNCDQDLGVGDDRHNVQNVNRNKLDEKQAEDNLKSRRNMEITVRRHLRENDDDCINLSASTEEHLRKELMGQKLLSEQDGIPTNEKVTNVTDDNDNGNEARAVHLEGQDVETHSDDDIEELQKLIEDQHLTKRDTQDLSDVEISNKRDDEDQSRRPYYDEVPSLHAGKRTSNRLTMNRARINPIPSPSSNWNSMDGRLSTRHSSVKLPPNVVKMSTVMTSAKKRRAAAVLRSLSEYYDVKKHAKLLRWDECVNSRPPLPIDLDLPGPWHYSPTNKPLYETNAPQYSFGMKFYERRGGARTAHAKTWFNSDSSYTTKVNFEKRWPSPAQYSSKPLLGRRNYTLPNFPVYSVGVRSKFAINKKGSEYEPSPNEYYPNKSNYLTLHSAPAYSFGARHSGTCISVGNTDPNNPGPGNYTPRIQFVKPHRPSFTIKGERVPKSHMLGPHATL